MKYIALRGFCLGNGVDVFPGDYVEMDGPQAALLVRHGRMKPVAEEPPKKEKTNARK